MLHELSYSLRYDAKQMTRAEIAQFLLSVLSWPGVDGDKDVMVEAVQRCGGTPGLGFVDAYLAMLAIRQHRPVYTKNVNEFAGQGVGVPGLLPDGAAP